MAAGSHRDGVYHLVFDQKLVHESGINRSSNIRFSVQIRYSNLEDAEYAARGWPRNHKL